MGYSDDEEGVDFFQDEQEPGMQFIDFYQDDEPDDVPMKNTVRRGYGMSPSREAVGQSARAPKKSARRAARHIF